MLKFILLYLIIAACFYVNVNHASAPNCSVKPELTTRGPLGISGRPGSKGEPGKGQKGEKGEPSQNYNNSEEFKSIEKLLFETEKQHNNLYEETKRLMSVVATLASRKSRNCDDLFNLGLQKEGVYGIFIGGNAVQVYCEFDRDGYNWLVFQRRINGKVDFYLNWDSYVNGFGNKNGEFWLGLQALHEITSSQSYRLRVDLEDWEGNQSYAEYSSFFVGNLSSNYKLIVGGYNGSAGDSLIRRHNGRPFTTRDRDNDAYEDNCAILRHGAYWYNRCQASNLNGKYYSSAHLARNRSGIHWYEWRGPKYSMKRVSMKIRPNN